MRRSYNESAFVLIADQTIETRNEIGKTYILNNINKIAGFQIDGNGLIYLNWRRGRDSNPRCSYLHNRFRVCRLKPDSATSPDR